MLSFPTIQANDTAVQMPLPVTLFFFLLMFEDFVVAKEERGLVLVRALFRDDLALALL